MSDATDSDDEPFTPRCSLKRQHDVQCALHRAAVSAWVECNSIVDTIVEYLDPACVLEERHWDAIVFIEDEMRRAQRTKDRVRSIINATEYQIHRLKIEAFEAMHAFEELGEQKKRIYVTGWLPPQATGQPARKEPSYLEELHKTNRAVYSAPIAEWLKLGSVVGTVVDYLDPVYFLGEEHYDAMANTKAEMGRMWDAKDKATRSIETLEHTVADLHTRVPKETQFIGKLNRLRWRIYETGEVPSQHLADRQPARKRRKKTGNVFV